MMNSVCTWDEVFTRKKKKPNMIFLILYWYLFNRSDYESNIVTEMRRLKKLKEFKDIPSSITEKSNITTYIGDMERYNLVGIKKKEGKRKYYQALSFFYMDPFCVKTPELRGKTIEEHYEEYKKCIIELGLDKRPDFDTSRNNAVIPAQEVVHDFSSDVEKFMMLFFQKKGNIIIFYDLIREAFSDLDTILYAYEKDRTENLDLAVLDAHKAQKIFDYDKPSLLTRYHFVQWSNGSESKHEISVDGSSLKRYWEDFTLHCSTNAFESVLHTMFLYTDLQFERISFNMEKMDFEGKKTFLW